MVAIKLEFIYRVSCQFVSLARLYVIVVVGSQSHTFHMTMTLLVLEVLP